MRKILTLTALGAALAGAPALAQEECGDLSLSNMNWQSAEVLAALDQFILNNGYGCNAEIVAGDTVPSITSLIERGRPEVVPEAWVNLLPDLVEQGKTDGKIVYGANSLSDGGQQGWFIPKYIADAHPEILTIPELLKHPEMFPDPEDPSKGAIYNGQEGWGGTIVTTQMFKAYGASDLGWNLIDTGSAAGLDGAIARAYENQQPIVAFYWEPTALLGKYEMVRLQHGVPLDDAEWERCTSKADCPDPEPNDWKSDVVYTLISADFAGRAPQGVMDYLNTRSWTNDTVNKLMAWMTDNQATGEDGAREFLRTQPELWEKWVTPEAAEKIKAAL
ncbi:glycine betaine ABC transporter substrate-binding protein [Paracoccus chinensis]|uniref:Glycine betaine/proline transport system substrate-binding protein n=1 Tax=Paracoccus chinensis TaxID=525640 RepID=A0A1G9MNE0_9RHOB|nr:glycine betaine ABC transporter substrate-binding protein [Paracoccus chinensis]SDL75437.1 glycine betaine/proline transport system substrate-binding protein [Paracoccus chinensis]